VIESPGDPRQLNCLHEFERLFFLGPRLGGEAAQSEATYCKKLHHGFLLLARSGRSDLALIVTIDH
jgi:hypothetical protein